jgi:hypothetical protein
VIEQPGCLPRVRLRGGQQAMNDDQLTAHLAECVMRWRATPDRFIKSGRTWIPKWRFQPLMDLTDAFRLLDHAADRYSLTKDRQGIFSANVQISGHRGKAVGEPKARAITIAVARALGLEV